MTTNPRPDLDQNLDQDVDPDLDQDADEVEHPEWDEHGARVANLHGRANIAIVLHGIALCFLALPSVVGGLLALIAHRTAERHLPLANRLVSWSKAFFVVDLVFYLLLLISGLTLAVRKLA
jgi:hypothetical protein